MDLILIWKLKLKIAQKSKKSYQLISQKLNKKQKNGLNQLKKKNILKTKTVLMDSRQKKREVSSLILIK